MKCSNCGASFRGNFCPECGARAAEQSTVQARHLAGTGAHQTHSQQKNDSPGCVVMIRIWAAVIGCFVGAAAMFMTGHIFWGIVCFALSSVALLTMLFPLPGKWTEPVLRVCAVLLVVLIVVFVTTADENNENYVAAVRNGYPRDYPDITFGEAFEQYFQDGEWSYAGDNVIVYTGDYLDESGLTNVRFEFLLEDDAFSASAMYIDGVSVGEDWSVFVLFDIFESYNREVPAAYTPAVSTPAISTPNPAFSPDRSNNSTAVTGNGPEWCSGNYYGEDLYSQITFFPGDTISFNIFIYRLIDIENCTGTVEGDRLVFTGDLDVGGSVSGTLTYHDNGDLDLSISSSDFGLLETGTTLEFYRDYADLSYYEESDDPLCGIYAMPDNPSNRLFIWKGPDIYVLEMMNRDETLAVSSFLIQDLESYNDILYFQSYTNGAEERIYGSYDPRADTLDFGGEFSQYSVFSQYGYEGIFFRQG